MIRAGIGILLLTSAIACKAPPELRPDQELRDSLGLTDRDRVHRVDLLESDGVERSRPTEVSIRPGDHVAFRNADRRARAIRFDAEGAAPEVREWIAGVPGTLPVLLAEADMRWVVSFEEAPVGRYPFVVLGGAESGDGVVVVEPR